MKTTSNCYWSDSRECKVPLFSEEENVFIIGSCNRMEFIDQIKKILKNSGLNPIFAEDLKIHNNLDAFCDNICHFIRSSRLIINDISAPDGIICEECKKSDLIPSLNVYWEYGYAAGLGKPQIVICSEDQISKTPFDVAGKQIQKYNESNLEEILTSLIKNELEKPLSKYITKGLISFDSLESIDVTLDPNDARIQILEVMVKNLTIKYYSEGCKAEDNTDLLNVIKNISKISPGYSSRFAPGNSVNHTEIIGNYFGNNITPTIFKNRIDSKEIDYEDVLPRSPLIKVGESAHAIYNQFKNSLIKEDILIDDIRKEYEHLLLHQIKFLKESFVLEDFRKSLEILEDYGTILTTGLYTGSDCEERFDILSSERLEKLMRKYSLSYIFNV